MKTKILDIIFALALAILVPFVTFDSLQSKGMTLASAQKTCYARIEVSNGNFGADFFNNSKTESLFQIPNHYYVLATGVDGEFLQVRYRDELSGYVRRSDAILVSGTPSAQFPNISLSPRNNTKLYNAANDNSDGLSLSSAQSLIYFGEKVGAGLQIDKYGTTISTWYYTRTDDFHYGYIFINDVYNIPNADRPVEDPDLLLPAADQDFFAQTEPTNFTGLSLGTQIMLIIAIGVPSLLILYFLIKPTKIMQSAKNKDKTTPKKKKRVSHGDYFEFDESEL